MAHLLTRRTTDPGMARWDEPARRVTEAARALVKSTSVDDALRGVARVAVQCAACHVAARSLPTFAPAPLPPPDRPTREVRMARHAWAADRLWEGIIGADDARWTSGLTVLAAEPLPPAVLADRSQFAKRLQARAREALEAGAIVQLEARGIAYGEMLTLCAGCHSSQRSSL